MKNRKKNLLVFLVILFAASALVSPIYVNTQKENWKTILSEKNESARTAINNAFKKKIEFLVASNKSIKSDVKRMLESGNAFNNYSGSLSVFVYDSVKKLIRWNSSLNINPYLNPNENHNFGEVVFKKYGLLTCLELFDTLKLKNKTYYLSVNLPIQKSYKLNNGSEGKFAIKDSLSHVINTSLEIGFDKNASRSKDGRVLSFPILNNFNNKIGIASFEKPALDNELEKLEGFFNVFQSLLMLLIYLAIGYYFIDKYKHIEKKLIKFTVLCVYLSLLRIFLFMLGIPTSYFQNTITDSLYFSSTFAFGIVKSPLELFITLAFVLLIILTAFRYLSKYYYSDNNRKNLTKFILSVILFLILFFPLIRGLGASLRSVVFDSSIRYFKEFNLLPDAPTLLMDFNILAIGFGIILISLILFSIIFIYNPFENKKGKLIFFIILFVVVHLLGYLYDVTQLQPQGTHLIRTFVITIVFAISYLIFIKNYRSGIKYLLIAFGASIATVSLLTYYNSEIERESLKITAQELTRSNESIYQFLVFQTLNTIKNEDEVSKIFDKETEYNSTAFIIWSKSLLNHESIPAFVGFYDSQGRQLGSFTNYYNERGNEFKFPQNRFSQELKISIDTSPFNQEKIIYGSVPIAKDSAIVGHIEVGVLYDPSNINFTKVPRFLVAQKIGISSAIDLDQINIFYFLNGRLAKSSSPAQLSEADIRTIVNTKFSKYNEAWLKLTFGGEKHVVYISKLDHEGSAILAISKEEKIFSWNLSDFFKVFFIHSIIIIAALLFLSLLNLKKLILFLRSYRTKLAAAFVVVSVIPMILMAVYIKQFSDNRNKELIVNRLNEMASQVENYLSFYSNVSIIDKLNIFEKASRDLNIKYSVFSDNTLEYSSVSNLYEAGLISKLLPGKVYDECFMKGLVKTYDEREIENQKYYSVYLKTTIDGKSCVIEINNLFNKTLLPLSEFEINIFMFGIYSLAVILLIIFSTILAEQISFPIRKLTGATRSVGSGDLNIEVTGNFNGEIADLADGFNMMVKKLNKSQADMALLEREAAWKEMAKQVAHEIKNPLTPMKLAVQQLSAAYIDKSPKFDSIFQKVTSTIITQIETLKNIASEFSNFARMPRLNIERIDIVDVIKDSINLFADEKLIINFKGEADKIFVNADIDQLNRTMINLIRNAIQAGAKSIYVTIKSIDKMCEIRVSDDGSGISELDKEKIFEENFTTKTKGMGLGLTMAKRFLESINGTIIVEDTSTSGTSFLIKIPLAD